MPREKKMEGQVTIDDHMEMPAMQEVPKPMAQEQRKAVQRKPQADEYEEELVNPLRNERVIVRFVPKPYLKINNPKHILYGGLAENATVTYVVPKLSTGMYKNILTDNEKAYLEKVLGLEYNALSVYKKNDNFWDDSNDAGIGKVVLHKQDNYLDLSNPEDYIKYKILLANKDFVAPDLHALEDHPKATYRFVIVSEETESKIASNNMSVTMQCYKEFGKIEDDNDTLRFVLEVLEGRPSSNKLKPEYMQSKINEHIQARPKMFLSIVKDPLLKTKVLIRKCMDKGLIGKKNDCYYLRRDNTPLCEMNETSTLNNAAKYLNSIKRQELLFTLQEEVKN